MTFREIVLDFYRRFTSRKFLAAVGGFSLIMLDGLEAAEFSAEVLAIAATGLVGYIGAEAVGDTVSRMNSK
jgi:hypothetical protein